MTKYTLSVFTFGIPMPQPFSAPSDHDAVWWAKGFIAGYIGRDPSSFVGSEWTLHETPKEGGFNKQTFVGVCLVEELDGVVGQSWRTPRRPRSGPDMDVGDPHDGPGPAPGGGGSASGKIRKKASGAR